MSLSDLGLSIDIIAVLLLAKFSVPTNDLKPDGTEGFNVGVDEAKAEVNIQKYKLYKKITFFAYGMLCTGFLLQLKFVQQLFN
ncbi:hypothetical protein A6E08_13725 [Vibrio lentus]|nr:hypothetical protein A6E08_13725 [Vibrio lentus]PMI57454.1 hypothetical protein BCU41_07160 [Vibrio lentus]PMI89868.1 hypothetical protein BCU35_05090 [Vibrio lentus]PMJ00776.1 hypothetical protein BCU32_10335 [Vibrio lentus]